MNTDNDASTPALFHGQAPIPPQPTTRLAVVHQVRPGGTGHAVRARRPEMSTHRDAGQSQAVVNSMGLSRQRDAPARNPRG